LPSFNKKEKRNELKESGDARKSDKGALADCLVAIAELGQEGVEPINQLVLEIRSQDLPATMVNGDPWKNTVNENTIAMLAMPSNNKQMSVEEAKTWRALTRAPDQRASSPSLAWKSSGDMYSSN